jgi:Uncharacterised protein family UPF0547
VEEVGVGSGAKKTRSGESGKSDRYAINPLAVGVVAIGAAVVLLACFLPAAEAPVGIVEVRSNSLIQGLSVVIVLLLAFGLAAAGDTIRSYLAGERTWRPIVVGAIVLVAAIFIGSTDNDALMIHPLDRNGDAITAAEGVRANPGIGIYALGLGGALMMVGGIWIFRSSAPVAPADPRSGAAKRCPDCAEAVQPAARVCRFCGHRFDEQIPSEANRDEVS